MKIELEKLNKAYNEQSAEFAKFKNLQIISFTNETNQILQNFNKQLESSDLRVENL